MTHHPAPPSPRLDIDSPSCIAFACLNPVLATSTAPYSCMFARPRCPARSSELLKRLLSHKMAIKASKVSPEGNSPSGRSSPGGHNWYTLSKKTRSVQMAGRAVDVLSQGKFPRHTATGAQAATTTPTPDGADVGAGREEPGTHHERKWEDAITGTGFWFQRLMLTAAQKVEKVRLCPRDGLPHACFAARTRVAGPAVLCSRPRR